MKIALSIAGFDPTSGAGITADLKVFHSLKVYGIGILSSLTAQNTLGVRAIESVSRSSVKLQLAAVLDDFVPDAAKSGMIYDRNMIKMICAEIDRGRIRNMVVDPVITSTSGKPLIRKDAVGALVKELIPRAVLVTPNIPEAAVITGLAMKGLDDMRTAAERIHRLGPGQVVIKGGHLKDDAVDVMYDGENYYEFRAKKMGGWFHGTGCAFSAAVTANLALGRGVREAVKRAKNFVHRSIEKSVGIGKGMRLLNV